MTPAEARALLQLPEGPAAPEAVRAAYLGRVGLIRLETDPAGFASLRAAYELLTHGVGAPAEELAAAHAEVAARPDAADARWRLLSRLPYRAGPAALAVLRDGAERDPDTFLDELLFHFPDKAPVEMLERARDGAGVERRLLIADAHAVQGRPADALEAFRTAMATAATGGPAPAPRLALRPVFSLHAHGQVGAAGEALALLRQRIPDPAGVDPTVAWPLRIADELGRIGDALPIDLRVAAANSARRGDFTNTPNEARFATERLRPRDLRNLIAGLGRDAPTLREIFALGRPLNVPGPRDFRIRVGVAAFVVAAIWSGYKFYARTHRYPHPSVQEMADSMVREIHKTYARPGNTDAAPTAAGSSESR